MKIYLAARFSKRPVVQQWACELIAMGHEIVSRWALRDSDHQLVDGLSVRAADNERRRFAEEDIEDLKACDCIISLMEEPRSNGRGGRHVEFGYALGLGKRMMIVGERETVFHHLIRVEVFKSFEGLCNRLDYEKLVDEACDSDECEGALS